MRRWLSFSIIILIALGCKKKDKYHFETGYYQVSTTFVYGTDSTISKTSNTFIGPKKTQGSYQFESYEDDTLTQIAIEYQEPVIHFSFRNLNTGTYSGSTCNMNVIENKKNYMSVSFDSLLTYNSKFSNGTMTIKRIDQ